ncbi:UNVERIFIED_CONTAM: GDP-mannose transporter into the lumen of the Golgi [Siphonaria sp. JEL0065]|nr:GDP-mannose transporter into the lumen of the Golgi [Siphonaria sp. JEL0065]
MTLILMAYGERIIFNGPPVTKLVLLSFAFMILSAVLAGWDDVMNSSLQEQKDLSASYFWMFSNCILTAVFSLTMKARISGIGFKDFDTVYFNQILGFPILLICSLLFERNGFVDLYSRFQGTSGDSAKRDWVGLIFAIFVSGIMQFGIAYCTAWCMRVTSSTTLSMVGTLNKLPLSIFGMIMFGDTITNHRLEGVLLALIGGMLYGQARKSQARASAQQQVLPVSAKYEAVEKDRVLDFLSGANEIVEKEQ